MTARTVLVLGAGGQVGRAIGAAPQRTGLRLIGRRHQDVDIADGQAVDDAFRADDPDLVINTAAYTAVDQAESEPEAAFATNHVGAAIVAQRCASIDIPLIHLSTDYVFDGTNPAPYREDDAIAPIGVYGRSKAAGEAAVIECSRRSVILRTSWIFSAQGKNFLTTMLRLGGERDTIRVVADQHGAPTAADDIANAVLAIASALLDGKQNGFGLFHFCGAPPTTWHAFACAIFEEAERHGMPVPTDVVPIATKDYPTPARRPVNSVLDCRKIAETYRIVQPAWHEGLRQYFETMSKKK